MLEGELLPIGWTEDEGPFGEFAGMYGDLKANPVFKITAITRRRDAVFQLLQMPWENAWLGAAATEAQVWNVLKTAGVDVVGVAVTEGSACRWSVIASIRKRAGGGKNALMAILALPDTKHAIVVDDDIDISRCHAGGVGAHLPGAGRSGRDRDPRTRRPSTWTPACGPGSSPKASSP